MGQAAVQAEHTVSLCSVHGAEAYLPAGQLLHAAHTESALPPQTFARNWPVGAHLVHGAQTVSRVSVQLSQTYVSAEHGAQALHTASWVAVHGETCRAPAQSVHGLQTVSELPVQAALW